MVSPVASINSVTSVSTLAPPRFKISRLFKRNNELKDVFTTQPVNTIGTLEIPRQSLDKIFTACCDTLDFVLNLSSAQKPTGVSLDDIRAQSKKIRESVVAIHVLGLSDETWVGKDTSMTVISLVLMLSFELVHLCCLLHSHWLYLDKELVANQHAWIAKSVDIVLPIHVPWEDSQDEPHLIKDAISLTDDQRAQCHVIMARNHLHELPKLFAVLSKPSSSTKLVWEARQSASLRKAVADITAVLTKINTICSRERWSSMVIPLPKEAPTTTEALGKLLAEADAHIEKVKPEVLAKVDTVMGAKKADFSYHEPEPKLCEPGENTGMWFVKSQQYQSWYNSLPGSPERFLWCLGGVGMGKSFLMNTIVAHHKKNLKDVSKPPLVVQIHFHADSNYTADQIVVEIVSQLKSQITIPTNTMVWIYNSLQKGRTPSEKSQLLGSILYEITHTYNILYFLDGLDKSQTDGTTRTLKMLVASGLTQRIICFSRRAATIAPKNFPDFTFWNIHIDGSDLETCLESMLPKLQEKAGKELSEVEVTELKKQVVGNSQGSFLLFTSQMQTILASDETPNLKEALDGIPVTAFDIYRDTFKRVKSHSRSKKTILTILAWVCVMRKLSLSTAIPYLLPQQIGGDDSVIRNLVHETLGILEIIDDSVVFANIIAEGFFSAEFSECFPGFVSYVEATLSRPAKRAMPKQMVSGFKEFVQTRIDIHPQSVAKMSATVVAPAVAEEVNEEEVPAEKEDDEDAEDIDAKVRRR